MAYSGVQEIPGTITYPDGILYVLPPVINSVTALLINGTPVNITAAQSGTIFTLSTAGAATVITLPALQAGLNYKFILSGAPSNTAGRTITISSATANKLNGYAIGIATGLVGVPFAGVSSLILGATAANGKIGDYADFICDGANWYIKALSTGTASAWTTA